MFYLKVSIFYLEKNDISLGMSYFFVFILFYFMHNTPLSCMNNELYAWIKLVRLIIMWVENNELYAWIKLVRLIIMWVEEGLILEYWIITHTF